MVNNIDRHPEDLKGEIRKRFGTLHTFERRHKLPSHSVSAALRRPYELVEKAIASALGIPPQSLWPSRYDANGNRLTPQPPENYAYARGRKAA